MPFQNNLFRTDPRKAGHITRRGGLLAYAVVLVAVPVAGAGLAAATRLALTAAGDGGLASGLSLAEGYFRMLSLSYLLSWMGALLSVPLVLLARAHGLFGWGSAMLGALALMELLAWGLMGGSPAEALRQLGPAAATLGLAFWLTVRLANPRGFG